MAHYPQWERHSQSVILSDLQKGSSIAKDLVTRHP